VSEEKTCCVEAAEGEDWDAPIALVVSCRESLDRIEGGMDGSGCWSW
jgi:hypothetical protein